MIKFCVIAGILALAALPNGLVHIELTQGDDFGYHIGDIIRTKITVQFDADYYPDETLLPPIGSEVASDIEFRGLTVAEEYGRQKTLTLNYQIFTAPDGVTQVAIPSQTIVFKFKNADRNSESVIVPTRTARVSPLVKLADEPSKGIVKKERSIQYVNIHDLMNKLGFQDNEQPIRMYRENRLICSIAILTGLALLIVFLAGLQIIRKRMIYRTLPIYRARREWQKLVKSAKSPNDDRLKSELLILHRAINEETGMAVFSHNISEFFGKLNPCEQLKKEVEEIFGISEGLFYDETQKSNPREVSGKIGRAIAALAKLERTSAKGRRQ